MLIFLKGFLLNLKFWNEFLFYDKLLFCDEQGFIEIMLVLISDNFGVFLCWLSNKHVNFNQ